jgi:HAAS domain-containing protein
MSGTKSVLVENYLRRLDAALAGLPADRRHEIIEEVAQHVADARLQLGQGRHDSDKAIPAILGQLGDPEVIAAEALEAEPGSAALAGPPPPIRHAIRLMYCGAVLSLAAAIADIATKNGLREVIATTPMARNLIGTATNTTFIQAAAVNLVAVVLWLLIARWSAKGSTTARTLACVLFALCVVAALIGPGELSALSPWPVAVRVLTVLGWIVGLGAIVLLWQRSSTAFIKARFSSLS